MKSFLYLLLVCLSALSAHADMWTLSLPETGILPCYTKATYLSRMHERHGGSHLGMQDYTVSFPFTDPSRSYIGTWRYFIQGNAAVSIIDAGGPELDLKKNELMVMSLPVSFIKTISPSERLTCTFIPRFAGDGLNSSHTWDLPILLDYRITHSPALTYSLGLAASPRFAVYGVLPYVSFSWQATPEWLLRLSGYELAALYRVNERLHIGPALSMEGGTWMVVTPQGQRIFRVRSLALTLLTEYNFAQAGKTKRLLRAEIGTTLASTAQFCKRNARKDPVETHHYKPGLLLSVAVDFRF